ncbi:MAG: acyl-CoA dehydrogenase family protein [Bdellovibrionales bacterium]|jgi:alkylation response protein AidB-like acyl-CoA dehydrogenase|nr:acyl-CoA dehydrogenase family protein [Bdellovibrionales bacterium]
MPGKSADVRNFYQSPPELPNPWASNGSLQRAIRARVSAEQWEEFSAELSGFAAQVVPLIEPLGLQAEREEPVLEPYDAWGNRIDEIRMSRAWSELDAIAAREGMVATGYERKHGAASRLLQFGKLALFHPASGFYTCPLAMTDGAARVIELYGDAQMKERAFRHLTSRVPGDFWTSGQWMTERIGGSDVSQTAVTARFEHGEWRLYGDKWFTSATTSQMAMVLARVDDEKHGQGLALFYVELRDARGRLRGIRVNRLKEKLGTKALPTAELSLEGVPGVMIGKPGEGVKKVAGLLNVTRLYNSVCCVGAMARGLQLMTAYSLERRAFGQLIADHPLHVETLASIRARAAAATELVFHAVDLMGKEECGEATPEESLQLRILTPLVKLYTAREAIHNASETIESFGGAGYIENTGVPKLLRDAQVFPIWEGTTNVLSLDTLRAMGKDNALQPLIVDMTSRLKGVPSSLPKARIERRLSGLAYHAKKKASQSPELQQQSARDFAIALAQTVAGVLLLERAVADSLSGLAASRFIGLIGEWMPREDDIGALELASVKKLALESY